MSQHVKRNKRNPWLPERSLEGYAPSLRRRYALRVGIADIWNGIVTISTLGRYGSSAGFSQTVWLVEQHAKTFKTEDATT